MLLHYNYPIFFSDLELYSPQTTVNGISKSCRISYQQPTPMRFSQMYFKKRVAVSIEMPGHRQASARSAKSLF